MGKKSSKTETTVEPPKWVKPIVTGAANQISGVVGANQGNLESIASGIQGRLPQLGEMAFGTQPVSYGIDYAKEVLGGKYLDSNPYLDSIVRRGEEDAANRVNSTFSLAGRTGSGGHAESLARGVATAGNALRYGNFAQERANQQQAAGMMPALTAGQYMGITPYLAAGELAGRLPYAGIGNLGAIGGLLGGYGNTTGKQPGGWGSDLLNAGASIASAAIMASDRSLKTDIEEVGEWDDRGDGLKRYRFRYRNDPDFILREGVMADEVERLRPWAYVPNFANGKPGVNYARLGAFG